MGAFKSGWEIKTLAIIAIFAVTQVSQAVLFPLTLSFFLYLLLNPVLEWMVKIKIPKVFAAALIAGGILILISSTLTFLIQPAINWIDQAPKNLQLIEKKFTFIKKSLGKINKAAETAKDITEIHPKDKVTVVTQSTNFGLSLFGLTSNLLVLIFSVLVFLFFLLIYFKTFIQHLENIVNTRKKIKENVFLMSLTTDVSNYLFTFSIICAGLGILTACIFWLSGLPDAILWGGMVMLLTYIPYLGHLIGIIVILFVSLITFDSWLHILTPPLGYLFLVILEGQIITPFFVGKRLNLNPLIVLLSIFIWHGLWGISGIIISVPFLITAKIVLEQVPGLSKYKPLLER